MGNTNIPGSLWINPIAGQLRYKIAIDKPNMWHHPLSVYRVGTPITYGQPVSIAGPGTIVPTNPQVHDWCVGIALEAGLIGGDIHILSYGKLKFNEDRWPIESIGKTIYVGRNGGLTLNIEEARRANSHFVIRVGRVVDTTTMEIIFSEDQLSSDFLYERDRVNELFEQVNDRITTESNNRQDEDNRIIELIDTERVERIAADEFETASRVEEVARLDGEVSRLDNRIDTEHSERTTEVDRLDDLIVQVKDRLEIEIYNRTNADNNLSNRIDTERDERIEAIEQESSTRQEQVTHLNNEVERLDERIETEHTERVSEVARLDERIDTEHTQRTTEDAALNERVDNAFATLAAHSERITNVDQNSILRDRGIEGKITDVAVTLNNRIDTEISNRISADNQLQNNILYTEQRLNDRLDSEIGTITSTQHQLQSNIQNTELRLNNRINTEQSSRNNQVTRLDNRINNLIDDIDSSVSSSSMSVRDQMLLFGVGFQNPAEHPENGSYSLTFTRRSGSIVGNRLEWIPTSDRPFISTRTVSFNTYGGNSIADAIAILNSTIHPPLPPTRYSFSFSGWFINTVTDEPFDFSTPITSNITLHARWDEVFVTVSYNTMGGSPISDNQIRYGQIANRPPPPTRPGHAFGTWFAESDLINIWNFNTIVTRDITLYASWTIGQVTVSFNSHGGSVVMPQTIDWNTIVSIPMNPTREGHTFQGWFTEPENGTAFNFVLPITANITIHAQWIINQVTLTFNSNGGPEIAPITQSWGTVFDAPDPPPNRINYNFDGWFNNWNLLVPFDFTRPLTINFEVFARWQEIPRDNILTFGIYRPADSDFEHLDDEGLPAPIVGTPNVDEIMDLFKLGTFTYTEQILPGITSVIQDSPYPSTGFVVVISPIRILNILSGYDFSVMFPGLLSLFSEETRVIDNLEWFIYIYRNVVLEEDYNIDLRVIT